ncbi:sigma factor [Aneurinibacillus migulanus]|nr:sigma factor [Aneurinibacillus migulanus]
MVRVGYQLYAPYNEQIVAVTGIAIRFHFYYGKYIFVYDLVTCHSERVTFSTWLYKIAYHHCLDEIRKQNRW